MQHQSEQKLVIYWSGKKIVALICAILLVPTIMVFIFSLTLKRTVINPEYYKSNFKKADVANRLINEGIPALILDQSISQKKLKDAFAKDLIILVIQKSIDPAWINTLLDKTVDEIVVFFKDAEKAGGKIEINLADTSKLIDKVSAGLMILEQTVPSCNTAGSTIDCSKINFDSIKAEITKTRTAVDDINIGVVNIQDQVSQVNSYFVAIQTIVREINTAFYLSLAFLIFFCLLIIGLEYKNIPFLGKIVTLPLAIGSFLSLIIIWLTKPVSLGSLGLINFNLPEAMNNIIADVIKINIAGIYNKYALISGIVLTICILAYVTVLILEKDKIIKSR